jgi:tol-pal system protein YbgF
MGQSVSQRKALLAIGSSLLLMTACTLTPPQDDPVLVKLDDIDRRLAALERIVASGSLVELTMQVDELQRQAAALQGRTESLEYDAEGTASRQRDLYVDLDDRLQNLERSLRAVNVMDGGSLAPGQLPVPGGSDRDNYQAAFELLKEQRYEQAAMAFQQFLVSYPDSQLADNALYWLAESYYVTDQFENALTQFQGVIGKFPRSRKVPDALLKIGYSNYELERWDAARGALGRVQADYPDTTAARLAEQRLNRMDDEGR